MIFPRVFLQPRVLVLVYIINSLYIKVYINGLFIIVFIEMFF